ncbi:MAG: hypothetical protein I8H71_01335 [Xanthomonadaceae bacterium]|nr:hypothetical protein [Xanthomonadaceae bacterium]
MTTHLLLQYTSVRTREVDGKVLIGLKHTYKDDAGQEFKTEWIEMPPEDAAKLVGTVQQALDELGE